MRKFTLISEDVKFEGRGNLVEILNSMLQNIEMYQEQKDFFNEHLMWFLELDRGDEANSDRYYGDLDNGELRRFYNQDVDYNELRDYIYKKYGKNIDHMDSLFLDCIYLSKKLNDMEKSVESGIVNINKD